MYKIKLLCSKCSSSVKEIISYTKTELVVRCPKCGIVSTEFIEHSDYKPQEFKSMKKLPQENYWNLE